MGLEYWTVYSDKILQNNEQKKELIKERNKSIFVEIQEIISIKE